MKFPRFWKSQKQSSNVATLPVQPERRIEPVIRWDNAAMQTGNFAGLDDRRVFTLPDAAPGVIPAAGGKSAAQVKMAVDSAVMPSSGNQGLYGYANSLQSAYVEGQVFLGFPLLAQMLQRVEYNRPARVIAAEMTRNWGEVTYTGETDKDVNSKKAAGKKKKELEDELKRLNVQHIMREALEVAQGYGRAQIYIDNGATDNPDELRMPLVVDKTKIKKGSLKALNVVEPVWTYPAWYNSTDPLKPDYYKPQGWFVMGKEVHSTRLLTIIPYPVADILKPAYAFAGLSLTQMLKPYVDNWLETRQSVNDVIQNFSTYTLKTNLSTLIQSNQLINRAQTFVNCKRNQGLVLLDVDNNEELQNVATPLGSLDKLQAQAQEHQSAACGIPFIKLFGITPTGLNASSEGELQAFYETLQGAQEADAMPVMESILQLAQLNIWGTIDPSIGWKWNPIKHLDAQELATTEKLKAETDSMRINDGIIDPAEVRSVLANDETSPYHGIDPNDVPESSEPMIGPGEGSLTQQEEE